MPVSVRMKWTFALLLAGAGLATAGGAAAQATGPAALVSMVVDEPGTAGGKPLKMSFTELRREADHSIVEVAFVAGASVPSSMFVVRGLCAVLRARGEAYFQSEQVGTGPMRYRVVFPKQPADSDLRGAQKKSLSAQECGVLGF